MTTGLERIESVHPVELLPRNWTLKPVRGTLALLVGCRVLRQMNFEDVLHKKDLKCNGNLGEVWQNSKGKTTSAK